MKKATVFILLMLCLIGCGQKTISISQLQERHGIHYEINQTKPFSGTVIIVYENGQAEASLKFKDGKFHGESITYYENGQMKSKENYKNNKLHGKSILYYISGQIESDVDYKNNLIHGVAVWYNKNGEVESRGKYENGQEIFDKDSINIEVVD